MGGDKSHKVRENQGEAAGGKVTEADAEPDGAADRRTPPAQPWWCHTVGTGVHSQAVHVRGPGASEGRPGWKGGTASVFEKAAPSCQRAGRGRGDQTCVQEKLNGSTAWCRTRALAHLRLETVFPAPSFGLNASRWGMGDPPLHTQAYLY